MEKPERRTSAALPLLLQSPNMEIWCRSSPIAREHKRQILELFVVFMAEAGVTHLKPAKHLTLLYGGSLATVAVNRDPKAVLAARDCALDVFDCAVASTQKGRSAKRDRDN
jgi:hypothetical protein